MFINSKKQGDAGVGQAIGYFTSLGHTVCIPLADSQNYDLVVDYGELKRVQVKFASYKRTPLSPFAVELRVKGGNKTGTGKTKFFDNSVDILFICTSDYKMYVIPTEVIDCKSCLTLCDKYDKYKVN